MPPSRGGEGPLDGVAPAWVGGGRGRPPARRGPAVPTGYCGGIRTRSIAWMTPLVALMSDSHAEDVLQAFRDEFGRGSEFA